jgi:hypothetical protein
MEAADPVITEPMPISVDFPDEPLLHLRISVGACRLRIAPAGTGDKWVTGTYEDPTGSMPYVVTQDQGMVKIAQKQGLGTLKSPFSGAPTMNLELGSARPYTMSIESGASESIVDLGGLPIINLAIKKGAGRAQVDFSRPNPSGMDKLDIDAGAVSLVVRNLANANFDEMSLDGGAASYELDFSGELKRDGHVNLNAGVSTVKVLVPASTPARIRPGSVLGSLDIGDGLMKKEGAFWNEAAIAGGTPVLNIYASIALGTLVLKVT